MAKRAKLEKLMENEKIDFSKFIFFPNLKNPLSDHIGWCSLTYTPNLKKKREITADAIR
jgi:hypothetical protein